ncbi:unnamed protein product [Arctogadus glacialis]
MSLIPLVHPAPPTKGVFWPDPDDGNLDTPPCNPGNPPEHRAPGPRGPASEQTLTLGPQTLTKGPQTLTQGPRH